MRTNKYRGNITPSLLCGILCALTLCGYIPAISYLSNANFYSFTLSQLLLGMLPAFLAMTALLSALLFVLVCLFQAKCPRLACETPGGRWRLTIVHVALALLVFAIWLEGSPLSFGLPQLTGDTGLFSSTSRAVWDSLVWVAVLVTAALFWRVLGQNLAYVLVGVCLLMALGLGDAAKNSEPRAQVSTTANEVLDRVSLHAEDNVLVLILDAMSTAVIQDYLTENPDFGDALDGFTLFQNNLESASSTQWALPSMLKGDIYNGGPVLDYQSDLYDAPESVAQTFYTAGYDVYASSTLPRFNRYLLSGATQANESRKAVSLPRAMYGQFWVRFVPYALKNTVSSRADISGTVNDTVYLPGGNLEALEGYESAHTDEITYQVLSMAAKRGDSPAPTFQFHHVNGSHKPYTIGSDGHPLPEAEQGTLYGLREQSAWTLRNVEKLLLALKADGRYDGATIVLLGDHGDRLDDSFRDNMAYARHAALLVKPVGSHGPLAFSTAPTSNSYLPQLLTAVHLEGMDLHAATAGLPEQRQVLMDGTRIHVYEGTDVTALTHVETIEVVQEYDATVLSRGKQYVLSTQDVSAEMAYPLHFENGNISNGWGLRILGEEMRACFLVDARPGQPVNAHIVLTTSALVGGYTDFTPYDLTVRDETGGREWVFPVDDNRTRIKLNDVAVSEDATVQLAFSLSRHPDPDTMQVSLRSILLEEPSQEVRDNATVLQPNTWYSLATNKKDVAVAYPLAWENADFSNGWGLRIQKEEMNCAFLVNAKAEQRMDLDIVISTSALAGGYPEFEPYDLTVRDQVSGLEEIYRITESRPKLLLKNLEVGDDGAIRLCFSLSKHPDPQTMQVTLVELQPGRPFIWQEEPTALVPGTRYVVSARKQSDKDAFPLEYENANIQSGLGLLATAEEMRCAFLVLTSPTEKLNVTMTVSISPKADELSRFKPYELTVRDTVSGKTHTFTVYKSQMELRLNDVSVAEDFSIRFAYSGSEPLHSTAAQFSLVEIMTEK